MKSIGILYGYLCKTVEPIKMLFAWARMGPRNHAVDGGPEVLRDVAMAILGLKLLLTGFV